MIHVHKASHSVLPNQQQKAQGVCPGKSGLKHLLWKWVLVSYIPKLLSRRNANILLDSEAKKDYMAEELVGLYRGIWRDMAHALSTIHQTRFTETPALLSDQSSLLAEVTNLIRWSPPIQPRRTELANFTRNLSDSSFIYTSLSVQNQVPFPLSEHTLATETMKFYISTRSLTTFSLQK